MTMAYQLDTNVVSELRKTAPHPRVTQWHASHSHADVYLSTLVIGEIRRGIDRLRPRDPKQADVLERWLSGLTASYRERLLPSDSAGRREAGPDERHDSAAALHRRSDGRNGKCPQADFGHAQRR
jgi:predicted nucleic acid-binding protein